ncbi:hypothetical protein DSO57_1018249 [Entomophthora muscae]|uniref:Uncharacterized protein n=1 Tax=Entomophthora muscae TaxID=34485 RepID=A0ACC2T486_9FUNG|nr:hypothetical protein DSO57_1018249 [Entomophthora muscae]
MYPLANMSQAYSSKHTSSFKVKGAQDIFRNTFICEDMSSIVSEEPGLNGTMIIARAMASDCAEALKEQDKGQPD